MLRILFILLAVVSALLAYVLQEPLLFGAAAVLLLIAAIVLFVHLRRRHRRAQEPYTATAASKSQDDELAALGIVGIRPKQKPGAPPEAAPAGPAEPVEAVEAEAGGPPPEPAAEEPPVPAVTNGNPAPAPVLPPIRRQRSPVAGETADDRQRREVLDAFLHAIQAALDATTVCLLRQEESTMKYHIEAIVSRNHYARSQGHFTAKTPLLTPAMLQRPVSTRRVGGKGLSPKSLGYYLEPIVVRQLAVAPVAHPTDTAAWFLLADTMEDGGLGTGRQRKLLAEFAVLLASILDPREVPGAEGEDEDVTDVRPRREIVEEEMRRARIRHYDLALALLYLNRAEQLAEQGADAVAAAETRLEARLREVAGAARVERFGELTYGLFYHTGIADVEAAAGRLQRLLADETGVLEGGVSIGVAMLTPRHQTPEAFRADATEALHAAYESGACTILE